MRFSSSFHFAVPVLVLCGALSGCGGSSTGPSLLMQKDVNGTYNLTATGTPGDQVMFTAQLASGNPLADSGPNYYSPVSGSISNSVAMDLGDCNGQTISVTGKITNPDHNNVYINLTGQAPGGGTLTLDGKLDNVGVSTGTYTLGSAFAGTIQINGGSCPMSATAYVANW